MKILNIDFLYLDLNVCERCMATDVTLDEALDVLAPVFKKLKYSVKVKKVNVKTKELAEQYLFVSSPTIRVNGADICTELKENECENCGDLCGDKVDCRVFVYNGKDYEQPPAAMIIDGILSVIYGKTKPVKKPYKLPENLKNYFTKRKAFVKKQDVCGCKSGCC